MLRRGQGPADGFDRLFAENFRDITGYVARRVPGGGVDDVVAKVFTVAWRRFRQVPPPPDDRPWLFGVARRCVDDERRSDGRQERLRLRLVQEGARSPGDGKAHGERHDLVLEAMERLPPLHREALRLVLWDGLSHVEAAAVLECSVAAFESRFRRARNTVRDAVNQGTGSQPDAPVPERSLTCQGEVNP